MADEILIKQCSPTLAGIKTANLFPVDYNTETELIEDLRNLNKRLYSKGISIIPVKYKNHKALIYAYRPGKLKMDLSAPLTQKILFALGYPVNSPQKCIAKLMGKLRTNEAFPHEIGLFLGYPPEDVRGFIENKDECKAVGFWKVYTNVEKAETTFNLYRKCFGVYYDCWKNGFNIERLTVAA